MNRASKGFRRLAWGALAYNILVILWGAIVRATSSGAGCGNHWPLCNGVVIPQAPQTATIIEFIHRISSGLVIVPAVWLLVWVWWKLSRNSKLRWTTAGILLFTLTEALVGALLVTNHLTGADDSVQRAVAIVVHLVNTFLLLASLALTAWWSSFGEPKKLTWNGLPSGLLLASGVGLVFLGASGAITALGDTLFPVDTLAKGLQQDVSPTSHFLIQLRVYHPLFAVFIAVFGGYLFRWLRGKEETPLNKRLISGVMVLFGIQLLLGGANVLLLAPVWMQIVHLLVTDLIWTGTVVAFSLSLSRFTV